VIAAVERSPRHRARAGRFPTSARIARWSPWWYDAAMEKVKLAEALSRFTDHWNPKVVGDVNDAQIKRVKLKGEFVWHHHEQDDEMFLVLAGRMTMRFRDREIVLEMGEMIIVPRGVEHQPAADDECHVLLVEPRTTLNMGERTARDLERIA
jgi:mannose-6-phosphate isomerase-like protein (cupin superfamily)